MNAAKPKPKADTFCWAIAPYLVRDFWVGVLSINNKEYSATFTDDTGVRLTKSDGTTYHIDLANGHCDCPDNQYRHHRRCKHLRYCAEALRIVFDREVIVP